MSLIINADDFGKDTDFTDGITASFEHGWINRTTLMVNMPDCNRAAESAHQLGFSDRVGLHLNLIEGIPLTDRIRYCRRICDSEGRFRNFLKGRPVFWDGLDLEEREAVAEEIEAQVKKFLGLGLMCRHCDGHQHCHCKWAVLPILLPILKRYEFVSIRRPNNVLLKSLRFPHVAIRQRLASAWIMSKIRTAGLSSSRYMDGFAEWKHAVSVGAVGAKDLAYAEIMVHPKSEGDVVVNKYEKSEYTMKEVFEILCR